MNWNCPCGELPSGVRDGEQPHLVGDARSGVPAVVTGGATVIFGAILAGGVGSRMNIESMPKQYLPLAGKPVFLHTLEKFLLCDEFDAVYVGTHPNWVDFTRDAVRPYADSAIDIHVVKGGSDRNGTIMSIIDAIEADYGPSPDHIIVTHDSVRPFVKLSTIKGNIEAARRYGACDTVIPATDTIVTSQSGDQIDEIPPRSAMYQGQTPQSFNIEQLKGLYASLTDEERASLTDACKVLVLKGVPVRLVPGDVTNIKLTTIMDYKVAQAMIESGVDA